MAGQWLEPPLGLQQQRWVVTGIGIEALGGRAPHAIKHGHEQVRPRLAGDDPLVRMRTWAGSSRLKATGTVIVRLTAMNKAAGTLLSATSAMTMPHLSSPSGRKS